MGFHLIIGEPAFYCQRDEKYFFARLSEVSGVLATTRCAEGLRIDVGFSGLGRPGLYGMIGLMDRYDIDMSVLGRFAALRGRVKKRHRKWLRNPQYYWHAAVFGGESG